MLGIAFYAEAVAAEPSYFACPGAITTAPESHDLPVRVEPWAFSLGIDSDRKVAIIDDTSMRIISDASKPVIGLKDDPSTDPSLESLWGGFNTVTDAINIYVGAKFWTNLWRAHSEVEKQRGQASNNSLAMQDKCQNRSPRY